MSKDILVSVVIPAYNSEVYISQCLDATVKQTYSNIEIIVVNDGSSDSTTQICNEYADKDDRIRIIECTNNGVSAARNTGIDNSSGEYIVFFDADDRPEKDIIEHYIAALNEWQGKNLSFILCGMFYDDLFNRNVEDRMIILESIYGFIEGENYLLKRNYASTLAWLGIFNFVTNKFYDLKLIKEHGLRFDEKINIGEDITFNLDYLSVSSGYIGMVNKPLYHYIKRNTDSLSYTYHENDIEDTKAIYRRFLDWESKQKGVDEDKILVIKSIYLSDWLSRLNTMNDTYRKGNKPGAYLKKLNAEIGSAEYQELLKEVRKAKKISWIRYVSLRSGDFRLFRFLRDIYQFMKR